MSLRIRRGLESDRITKTLESGELGYATDTYRLYVGDGVTSGGRNVLATAAGSGLTWNATSQQLDFTGEGSGITSVSADTSPHLGGNLSLNSHNITGTGNISIVGTINATNGLGGSLNLNSNSVSGPNGFLITNTGYLTSGGLTLSSNSITSSQTSMSIGTSSMPITTIRAKGQKLEFTNATVSGGILEQAIISQTSRGTINAPTSLLVGDLFGTFALNAHTGSSYIPKVIVNGRIDNVTGTNTLPGAWAVSLHDYNGNYTAGLSVNSRSLVIMSSLKLSPFATTTARDTQIGTPQAGMITFVTDNGSAVPKLQCYDGTTWRDLF